LEFTAICKRRGGIAMFPSASTEGIGHLFFANSARMKRLLVFSLVALLLIHGANAVAGKRKKGPKPYTSNEVTIAISHPVLTATGHVVNVTIQEFKNRCALPASQGFDAHIFEVPADYKKIEADAAAIGAGGTYDLDMFYFDQSCAIIGASQEEGTDEVDGIMPAGTAYIAMHNHLGDPNVAAHIELASIK
jgi:hypothetical protein